MSFKFPGGRGFDWHQNIVFFLSSNRSPIMTLTFVEYVDADTRPTRVIPGLNLGEVYDHYDADGDRLALIGEHVKSRAGRGRDGRWDGGRSPGAGSQGDDPGAHHHGSVGPS